ncbi:MAG: 1-acyl-sn-glycerol-3-phosphate acyltransferase [Treponema sp.]|jgi:1-acyl-sn-glycerol-3-phosphate acyltransferase|nr:1-acyl-sn-glycerol-3-phosphate acyltransferase [Treponema sp.]
MTPEEKAKYSREGLPKIKNIFTYSFNVLLKIIFLIYFGVGAMILAIVVFPFLRLYAIKKDFGVVARAYVSRTFRDFLKQLSILGGSKVVVQDREYFKNIHGKVIVANHPSLLDFVYIMSLVPNSNCIVRGGLTKTPLAGVIKQAYITNTTEFDDLCKLCKETIDKGNNVIIFPEGTRSPRHGKNNYKKGAARIALYSNANVLPLFIGGTDKYGLGKKDPLFSYNPVERYVYDIQVLPEIDISEYKDLSEPIAAKHVTEKMESLIRAAGDEYPKTHSYKTYNNY